jgi:hypothetical protein
MMINDLTFPTTHSPATADSAPEILAPTVAQVAVQLLCADTPTTPVENETAVIARLATLNQMDYDRIRKEEAKALGIQVKTLDDMVKTERNQASANDGMPFATVDPWPEPVNPAELFDDVAAIILNFIVLDTDQAYAAALWLAHTHLIDEADTSPIAIINAPEKACAKTLFQTVLGRMAYRPLPASNASLSALFRAVERWKPTLFIDEADTFFRANVELQGMINAGYKRGGYVLRSEASGDSFEPRMFSVYSPKSIAGIALEKHLPDSTMSRGIQFNLRRKLPHETVERLRHADGAVFDRLASKLARFAMDYSQQVRMARPVLPDALSDREQDNWEPLLAIAGCAGEASVERATRAALSMSSATESSVSTGNELLADIQSVFESKKTFKISTVELIDALVAEPENAWATYNKGRPLSPRQLAKQLATYGIQPKTVRMAHGTPKGYDADQFADAFLRYLAAPEKLPQQRNATPATTLAVAGSVADEQARESEILRDAIGLLDRCGVADTPKADADIF